MEAQIRTDAPVLLYPACRSIFGDGGLDVCAKVRRARDAGHE